MTDTVFLLGNIRAADWANIFLQDLTLAFQQLGREAVFLMCEDGPLDVEPSRLAAKGSFTIDINGKRDTSDYPKFSLVVGHPFAHPRVASTLERGDAADIAAAAMPLFEAGHTWGERAERILVAMSGLRR
jgi:hypothetical protein